MSKVYTDVFNIKHTDCTVVDTINEFSRIFIIQDKHGSRFTCLKDDALSLIHISEPTRP